MFVCSTSLTYLLLLHTVVMCLCTERERKLSSPSSSVCVCVLSGVMSAYLMTLIGIQSTLRERRRRFMEFIFSQLAMHHFFVCLSFLPSVSHMRVPFTSTINYYRNIPSSFRAYPIMHVISHANILCQICFSFA